MAEAAVRNFTINFRPRHPAAHEARSKASPIAEVAASSNQTFWISILFLGTSRKTTSGSAEASLSHRGQKLFR